MKKFLVISIIVLGIFILISPFILIKIGQHYLNDDEVPLKSELLPESPQQRIMVFFPHPDDEITVAGTLLDLKEKGHEIFLVMLTKGDAGSSPENYPLDELAKVRTEEIKTSAKLLGLDSLILLDYKDGEMQALGLDSIERIANYWIEELSPDILLSYDSKVGLYGHEDHRLTGLALENVFRRNSDSMGFTPKHLYQVTLSNKQIDMAMKLSEGFRKNYPKDKENGLPDASFAVYIQPYFETKLKVMKAHHSQRHVLKDLMPYHDLVPLPIYSRIFDREYYHKVQK